MPKVETSYLEYLPQTLQSLDYPGLLLVTQGNENKPNMMTIGWATVGTLWGQHCFVVLVRPSRYSYKLLEENRQFTVNVLPADMSRVAEYCGSCSGRDSDKFAGSKLTPVASSIVKPPIIEECLVNYECQVVHFNDISPNTLPMELSKMAYPDGDYHRLYYGEIVACCADPNAKERLQELTG